MAGLEAWVAWEVWEVWEVSKCCEEKKIKYMVMVLLFFLSVNIYNPCNYHCADHRFFALDVQHSLLDSVTI